MGFLSDLTMVQRAGGAAVLVLILVMLLIKQRQAKGAPAAKPADAKTDTPSKKRESAPKEKKGRSFGSKRKNTSDDPEMPLAEPKSGSGRMVPRLPAASEAAVDEVPALEPVAFSDVAEPALAVPIPTAGGMISEPGWPTPGEVWAAPDSIVGESADVDSWHAGSKDDALAALTELPEADTTEWAGDESAGLDEVADWETSSEDVAIPVGQSDATWQAEEETFDWAAGDAIDGWATSAASEPAEDLTSGEAAWEAPEDEAPSWSTDEATDWTALEPVQETASVATAVAAAFSVSDWTPPETAAEVGEDVSPPVVEAVPEIVWDPVDEVEEPVVEEPAVAVIEEPVVEEPAVAVIEEPVVEEPAVAAIEEPVVEVARFEVEVPAARVTDPAARWASMAPGGISEGRGMASPVDSWTRLRPGRTAPVAMNGTDDHHTPSNSATALAPPPTAADVASQSLAWWDVPSDMASDPRRGRFALGGYALQPGHHVVSGVTFREGVVPPPTHWVIGPVVGEVAPGTLVLHVDGCLNCHPQDLAVLTDPGFAPTTDGFSLRLAAAATGPFAVSGTYTIR
jgi:hypothetical protein